VAKLLEFSSGPLRGIASVSRNSLRFAWELNGHWYATADVTKVPPSVIDVSSGTPRWVVAARPTSLRTFTEAQRALWSWATKTPADGARHDRMAPAATDGAVVLPQNHEALQRACGPIAFEGWPRIAKTSAHSLDAIRRTVSDVVGAAYAAWGGWCPSGLVIRFFDTSRAMGLALEPGTGAKTGVRVIALRRDLLENYDLPSLHRVVAHELCHHYRDERWGRTQLYGGHDDHFCEALARIDPRVAGSYADCRTFRDDVDEALTRKAIEKKLERRGGVPVWTPEAGRVAVRRLKSGEFRMVWEPKTEAGHRFAKITEPLSDTALAAWLQRFGLSRAHEVEVVALDDRAAFLMTPPNQVTPTPITTLDRFAAHVVARYPSMMRTTAAVLSGQTPPRGNPTSRSRRWHASRR
jgi:hypothetical protein